MKKIKQRLDVVLVEKGLAESRQRAQSYILAGKVWVDGLLLTKAGTKIPQDSSIQIKGNNLPYVSRGGIKLEAALKDFKLDVKGLLCLDVGASTGGFTDCLLQHGARHVIAVDVGYGQLHWTIRSDPRVTVMERTNIRYLDTNAISETVDLVCIDVSFISLRIVVPAVLRFVGEASRLLCLIKPQFEVGKGVVGKGGVVRDPRMRKAVVDKVCAFMQNRGLETIGQMPSPILGPKGNQEYFVLLTPISGIVNVSSKS